MSFSKNQKKEQSNNVTLLLLVYSLNSYEKYIIYSGSYADQAKNEKNSCWSFSLIKIIIFLINTILINEIIEKDYFFKKKNSWQW